MSRKKFKSTIHLETKNIELIKKQFCSILNKIKQCDVAVKSEAIKYMRECIDATGLSIPVAHNKSDVPPKCKKKIVKNVDNNHDVGLYKNKNSYQRVISNSKCNYSKPTKCALNKGCFKCEVCNTTKRSTKIFLNHLQSHPGISSTCIKCKKTFNNEISFNWHTQRFCETRTKIGFRKNTFTCKQCGKKFNFKLHYDRHLSGHKRNNCLYCGLLLTHRKKLVQHAAEAHNIKLERTVYKCDYCEKRYLKKQSLYYHTKKHLPNKSVCMQCGNTYEDISEYDDHMKSHEDEKCWQCDKCEETFKRRQQYLSHLKRHEFYKCLTCNQSYASKIHVIQHKRKGHDVEGLEPQMHCPYCSKSFCKMISLQQHMLEHPDSNPPIKCKYCDNIFHTLYQYYKHCMAYKHDPKVSSFICENCGKLFHRNNQLIKHLQQYHNIDQGSLTCQFCEYKTTNNTNLKRHSALHFNNEKLFMCEQCGNSFTSKDTLKHHINYIHSQKKAFPCDICEKTFKRNSELVRHHGSHSDLRPHVCKICSSSYKRSAHLRRHEESAHKIVSKTRRVQRLTTDNTGVLIPIQFEKKEKPKKKKDPKPITNETTTTYSNGSTVKYTLNMPTVSIVTFTKDAKTSFTNSNRGLYNTQVLCGNKIDHTGQHTYFNNLISVAATENTSAQFVKNSFSVTEGVDFTSHITSNENNLTRSTLLHDSALDPNNSYITLNTIGDVETTTVSPETSKLLSQNSVDNSMDVESLNYLSNMLQSQPNTREDLKNFLMPLLKFKSS